MQQRLQRSSGARCCLRSRDTGGPQLARPSPLRRRGLLPNASISSVSQGTVVVAPSQGSITKLQCLEYEVDRKGLTRAKYEQEGWSYWTWQGLRVHFAQDGQQGNPVVLLVHGYGASAYHWRYQFKELVDAGFHVFALDLIGFGLSEKASMDYSNGKIWISQISAFVKEVIGGGPVAIVGNSLGAYAALATAASHPHLISAVAMLNGAGPFRDLNAPPAPSALDPIKRAFSSAVKRFVMFFAFIYAKQPLRIKQVLDLVYVSKDQIDQDLVTSIQVPASDPNAADVFFRINDQQGVPVYVDDLLEGFKAPLLLLWGEADPWIVPSRAEKVKAAYPSAELRFIPSGHCPHDDTPELANRELLRWLRGVEQQQLLGAAKEELTVMLRGAERPEDN